MDQDQTSVTPPTEASPGVAPVAPAAPKPRGSGRLLNAALAAALVAAIGGVAFAAGRMSAPQATVFPGGGGNFPGGNLRPGASFVPGGGGNLPAGGGNFPGGGPGGGATLEGTVESVTDSTLTLKLPDGRTMQIALDAATTYHAQTDASSDDVATGGKVLVRLSFGAGAGAGGGTVGGLTAGDVTVVP